MSLQKLCKGRDNKIKSKGPLIYRDCFLIMLLYIISEYTKYEILNLNISYKCIYKDYY